MRQPCRRAKKNEIFLVSERIRIQKFVDKQDSRADSESKSSDKKLVMQAAAIKHNDTSLS